MISTLTQQNTELIEKETQISIYSWNWAKACIAKATEFNFFLPSIKSVHWLSHKNYLILQVRPVPLYFCTSHEDDIGAHGPNRLKRVQFYKCSIFPLTFISFLPGFNFSCCFVARITKIINEIF